MTMKGSCPQAASAFWMTRALSPSGTFRSFGYLRNEGVQSLRALSRRRWGIGLGPRQEQLDRSVADSEQHDSEIIFSDSS